MVLALNCSNRDTYLVTLLKPIQNKGHSLRVLTEKRATKVIISAFRFILYIGSHFTQNNYSLTKGVCRVISSGWRKLLYTM